MVTHTHTTGMIAITIDLPDSTAPDYVLVALVVEGKHLYTLTPLHKTPLIQKKSSRRVLWEGEDNKCK